MRYDERPNSHPKSTSAKHDDRFNAGVNDDCNAANCHIERSTRSDRFDVRAFAPQRRARRLPALSAGVDSDGFDERMPLFLEPVDQAIDDEACSVEPQAEGRDEAGFNVLRVRRRFYVRRLVRTGAAMAVAAAIAGALVLEPNFFDELGLFTNEIKNRISAAPFEPMSNFARTFASIPNTVATKESDQGASALAMDQLKRHATAFALASDDFSQGDTDAHATVSSRKLDPQEAAVDVQGSPRAIDQAGLTAQVTAAVATAPPVAVAPPRRFDLDELSGLMKRAKSLIAVGDIAPARLLLERAAEAEDASAAYLLAQTYDPAVLGTQDTRSITPDPTKARRWYERAVQFGSADAQERLVQMQN
jgi:hypothetical protein